MTTNSFYNHTSYPVQGAAGTSAAMRAELDAIAAGFALFPSFTGNASKILMVNAGETAIGTAAAGTNYVAPSAYASTNGLTMATAKLLGRTTASTGAAEEIAVGSGLSLSAGSLTCTVAPGVGDVTLAGAQTFITNPKTFTNSLLKLLGSSTGVTTFTSANAGASDYTITIPARTDTLVTLSGAETLNNKTFVKTTDTVHDITDGAAFEIDPANGNIQTITLGASRTPKATNLAAGQEVLLGIDDGSAYTITWTDGTLSPTWVKSGGTGAAPTLATTGYTWVMLWKVGSTVFGAIVGSP